MWQLLPPIILVIIYDNADLKTKLSASATCKYWRNALFSARTTIHEKLHLKFLCRPEKKTRLSNREMDKWKLFQKHTKCLILDWCRCQEYQVINMFSSEESLKSLTIQQIRFHSKGSFYGCDKESNDTDVIKLIVRLIDGCKNIRSIDFGSSPDLSRNADIIDIIEGISRKERLKHLNISCFETINQSSRQEKFLFMIKESFFKNLKEIQLNWDINFGNIITTLTDTANSIKVLGLLVHGHSINGCGFAKTDVSALWKRLKSYKPDIEVKLSLANIDNDAISTVLDEELPLTSLCVVYEFIGRERNIFDHLRTTDLGSNLKELGIHKIEHIFYNRTRQVRRKIRYVTNISSLVTQLEFLKNIEKLSFSGQFVLDSDLLLLVTQHAVSLKEVVIHKEEVVYKDRKRQGYYIPLTCAKVRLLEENMSTTLAKSWKMLKELPVQRYLGYLHRKELFWVMQNKGF